MPCTSKICIFFSIPAATSPHLNSGKFLYFHHWFFFLFLSLLFLFFTPHSSSPELYPRITYWQCIFCSIWIASQFLQHHFQTSFPGYESCAEFGSVSHSYFLHLNLILWASIFIYSSLSSLALLKCEMYSESLQTNVLKKMKSFFNSQSWNVLTVRSSPYSLNSNPLLVPQRLLLCFVL